MRHPKRMLPMEQGRRRLEGLLPLDQELLVPSQRLSRAVGREGVRRDVEPRVSDDHHRSGVANESGCLTHRLCLCFFASFLNHPYCTHYVDVTTPKHT